MKSGRPIPKSRATLLNPLLVRRSRQPNRGWMKPGSLWIGRSLPNFRLLCIFRPPMTLLLLKAQAFEELEEALKNATAAADTKEREVKGIEAEIAAYAAELETATQQLKDAEARLANAPKLLQDAADAKAAFEAAEQSQKAASDKSEATFKAMKTAEGACGTLEDQEDEQLAAIGKLNEEKTKINDDEVTPADTAYRTILSTLDPSEYDTDRIAAINKAEEALDDPEDGIQQCKYARYRSACRS